MFVILTLILFLLTREVVNAVPVYRMNHKQIGVWNVATKDKSWMVEVIASAMKGMIQMVHLSRMVEANVSAWMESQTFVVHRA